MCCDGIKNGLDETLRECVTVGTVVEEKGKKFRVEFLGISESICKIKVDKCLIRSNEIAKCDYLLKRCETGDYYFVELKGKDVNHAYEQIISTINELKPIFKYEKSNVHAFIIASSVPKVDLKFIKLQEKFIRDYGISLVRRCKTYILQIE